MNFKRKVKKNLQSLYGFTKKNRELVIAYFSAMTIIVTIAIKAIVYFHELGRIFCYELDKTVINDGLDLFYSVGMGMASLAVIVLSNFIIIVIKKDNKTKMGVFKGIFILILIESLLIYLGVSFNTYINLENYWSNELKRGWGYNIVVILLTIICSLTINIFSISFKFKDFQNQDTKADKRKKNKNKDLFILGIYMIISGIIVFSILIVFSYFSGRSLEKNRKNYAFVLADANDMYIPDVYDAYIEDEKILWAIVYENSNNYILCLVSGSDKKLSIVRNVKMVVPKEKTITYGYLSMEKPW